MGRCGGIAAGPRREPPEISETLRRIGGEAACSGGFRQRGTRIGRIAAAHYVRCWRGRAEWTPRVGGGFAQLAGGPGPTLCCVGKRTVCCVCSRLTNDQPNLSRGRRRLFGPQGSRLFRGEQIFRHDERIAPGSPVMASSAGSLWVFGNDGSLGDRSTCLRRPDPSGRD